MVPFILHAFNVHVNLHLSYKACIFLGLPNPTESMQNVHLFITLYQTNVSFPQLKPQVVFQNLHTTFNVMIFS